jgi:hypothetical protein
MAETDPPATADEERNRNPRRSSDRLDLHDFPALIITACGANVMRAFDLATIRAFVMVAGAQGVMGPSLVAARL